MMMLPDARFGTAETPLPDWRKRQITEVPDDDVELDETPEDVIAMLGFDPKNKGGGASDAVLPFLAGDAEFVESEHPRAPDGKFGSGAAQSISKAAKELKLDKAAKVSERLHSKLVDLNDEFDSVLGEIWDITPEDRAELEEGLEFEAEQSAQEYAYEKAPRMAANVRNNLIGITNKLSALIGDKPEGATIEKVSHEDFGLSHIQSIKIARVVEDLSGQFEEVDSLSDTLDHLIRGLDEDGDKIPTAEIDADEIEADIEEAEEALRDGIESLRNELKSAIEEIDQVINGEHAEVREEHAEYRKDFDRWKNMSSAERAAEEAKQRQEAAKQKDDVYRHREKIISGALSSGWKPTFRDDGGVAWNSVPEEVKNVASSLAGQAQMYKILHESGVEIPEAGKRFLDW